MTKKWSSTASMDGKTKRGASKDARAESKRDLQGLCAGGVDPGWGECPKCGATMDDECSADIKKVGGT